MLADFLSAINRIGSGSMRVTRRKFAIEAHAHSEHHDQCHPATKARPR